MVDGSTVFDVAGKVDGLLPADVLDDKGLERLAKLVDDINKYKALSDEELSIELINCIWADMTVDDPNYALIFEVIGRLKGDDDEQAEGVEG